MRFKLSRDQDISCTHWMIAEHILRKIGEMRACRELWEPDKLHAFATLFAMIYLVRRCNESLRNFSL